jgi:hypothetical protein
MKLEILFKELLPGERFISKNTERHYGGIKIVAARVSQNGRKFYANAVILTDHEGERARDAGSLIQVQDTDAVEVEY